MTQTPLPDYQPVSVQRLSDTVLEHLMLSIVRGAVAPGSALPTEANLARQFRVSRTVVREAVRALVARGLVEVRTRTGTVVTPPERWDHLDPLILFERVRAAHDEHLLDAVFELRRAIEVEAAALAAARRTIDQLHALSTICDAMRAHLDDPDTYVHHDIDFHDAILTASRNRLFQQALQPVSQVLRVGRVISGQRPRALTASQCGHEAIFTAIERGDSDEARTAMRHHLEQFEGDIRLSLGSGLSDEMLSVRTSR